MVSDRVYQSMQAKAVSKYGDIAADRILSPLYYDLVLMPTKLVFRFSKANDDQQNEMLSLMAKGGSDEQVARRVRRYLNRMG